MQINKKIVIGIIIAIILVLVIIISINKTKNNGDVSNNSNDAEGVTTDGVLFDEETGLYYLKNSETGEIIYASRHKEELQIYIDYPDYTPNPLAPRRTTLEDYLEEYDENAYEE